MSADGKTHINGVHTVAVPVTDQDRALEFYVGTLGFERRMDAEFSPGQRWVEVAPPGSATSIALVPTRDGVPAGVETGIRLTTSDADADHATLSANGVTWTRRSYGWATTCRPCSISGIRTATNSSSSKWG